MTTLAERRAWFRAGCPVHEQVHPRPPCPDDAGYLLEVWPDKHRLTAFCQWCSQMAGVIDQSVQGVNVLVSPRIVIRPLCVWMDRHAGNPDGTARGALTTESGSGRADVLELDDWADTLMLGNVVSKLVKVTASGSKQFYLLDPSPSSFEGDDTERLLMLATPAL